MLRNLILYWLTHCYAIICSIAIAAGDYFVFDWRWVSQWWGEEYVLFRVAGS
jgi:hypothetical protein